MMVNLWNNNYEFYNITPTALSLKLSELIYEVQEGLNSYANVCVSIQSGYVAIETRVLLMTQSGPTSTGQIFMIPIYSNLILLFPQLSPLWTTNLSHSN